MYRNLLIAFLLPPVLLLSLAACSGPASPEEPVELYLLAAASLTDAMEEIETTYEKEHPGVNIVPSYASSGKLKQQIEQGAPADLFLSAGDREMDELVRKKQIDPALRADLLSNELVLVVPEGAKNVNGFEDLKGDTVNNVSIGQPETVPAGRYAKQALERMKLWAELRPKLVFAGDVRQVLAGVKTGNADAGLVYRSDAATADGVKVVDVAGAGSHEPIRYPAGVVEDSGHPREAKALYEWLQGEKARRIFEKYEFRGKASR